MNERFRRALLGLFFGLVFAVTLSAVPVVLPAVATPPLATTPMAAASPAPVPASATAAPATMTPALPPLVAGVALGDCGDAHQAMVRIYSVGRRPPNHATKTCEGGRIRMRVETARHFGHRIMDPVRATVLLNFEPTTMIDLESLSRGTITFNGQEFDLVSPVALVSGGSPVDVQARRLRDGSVLLKIDLLIQSSVPATVAPYLVFRLDLRYAMGNIRDAQGQATATPDWRVLSTPPIGLTMSPTAVAGDQFLDQALQPAPQVLPWPTLGLIILGLFSILFMPGLSVVRWINRNRPGRIPSREEIAWRVIDAVNASARESDGYTKPHFRRIAHAVRTYFGMQSATISEVQSRLSTNPHVSEIVEVLNTCDEVLFEGAAIDQREVRAFQRKLKLIIPRP